MDNRSDLRRSTDVAVSFQARPSINGSGRILNISSTGAFLATAAPLCHLSLLYLQPLDPPSTKGAGGHLAATVVRCARDGFGLEWCEFGAASTPVYALLHAPAGGLGDARQLALALSQVPTLPPFAQISVLGHLT